VFSHISDHQGPLKKGDPEYMGSSWNLQVKWDDGSESWEPLHILAEDGPITISIYGKENGLLHHPGWKRYNRLANANPRLQTMINKVNSRTHAPTFQFEIQVPRW
jgi:hypothetical protein